MPFILLGFILLPTAILGQDRTFPEVMYMLSRWPPARRPGMGRESYRSALELIRNYYEHSILSHQQSPELFEEGCSSTRHHDGGRSPVKLDFSNIVV